MKGFEEKKKAERRFRPRSLYFKKDSMSIFTWLAMEKNGKKGLKNKK
jgi:hypothetical protein